MSMIFSRPKGFTLIEVIVSVGLFSIIMLLASAAYIQMISINRQAQAVATASDNLGYTLETMMRAIRTGHSYSCNGGTDCLAGGATLAFVDVNNCSIKYYAQSSRVVMDESGAGCPSLSASPLTDSSLTISTLKFYAQGTAATPTDYNQPKVIVSVQGSINAGANKTITFTLESGATLRGIDL